MVTLETGVLQTAGAAGPFRTGDQAKVGEDTEFRLPLEVSRRSHHWQYLLWTSLQLRRLNHL